MALALNASMIYLYFTKHPGSTGHLGHSVPRFKTKQGEVQFEFLCSPPVEQAS